MRFSLFRLLVLSTLVAGASGCSLSHTPQPDWSFPSACLVSAHRGGNRLPENSIAAIDDSFSRGADFVEIDVRATTDAAPSFFLFHDRSVSPRLVEGPADLIGADSSSLHSSDLTRIRLKAPAGSSPPSFTAALEAVHRAHQSPNLSQRRLVRLQLDLKHFSPELGAHLFEILKQRDAVDDVVAQIYDAQTLELVRSKYPKLAVLARVGDRMTLDQALAAKPFIIQLDTDDVDAEVSKRIEDSGALLLVRTSESDDDTAETWRNLYAEGVDIIMTHDIDAVQPIAAECRRHGVVTD